MFWLALPLLIIAAMMLVASVPMAIYVFITLFFLCALMLALTKG